jgi:hypothetical protein
VKHRLVGQVELDRAGYPMSSCWIAPSFLPVRSASLAGSYAKLDEGLGGVTLLATKRDTAHN